MRATGSIFEPLTTLTYVYATFDDDGLLIPYVPDLVVRFDGVIHGEIPGLQLYGRPIHGLFGTGSTYVAPRPLPFGERSNAIFTVDINATFGWSWLDLGFSATNLFDRRYRLGEYNYASDFHSAPGGGTVPTLAPARHFSAGSPRALFLTASIHLGGTE